MQVSFKTVLVTAGVVLLCFLAFAAYHTHSRNQWQAKVVSLQNTVAEKDQTIEVKEGVYQKLAIQERDLKNQLSEKDEEVARLKKQLDATGSQLLAATTLVVKLKHDLEIQGEATQPEPDPERPGEVAVLFSSKNEYDPFRVEGRTLAKCDRSGPPRVFMKMTQINPLRFSVVVSQDKDGTWRTSATSSSANFQVDIALASVNPYMLEPKWYEKIGLGLDLGVGTNPGLLAGLMATYEIGRFQVGPKVWVNLDRGVSAYFGATLQWHPFKR